MGDSFAFILGPLDFEGNLPIEIIPGFLFQRANPQQIVRIKRFLDGIHPQPLNAVLSPSDPYWFYEKTIENQEVVPLPPQNWRYWVVNFEPDQHGIEELQLAGSLLEYDIEIGFVYLKWPVERSPQSPPPPYISKFHAFTERTLSSIMSGGWWRRLTTKLQVDDLAEIGENYRLIQALDSAYNHVRTGLNRFDSLNSFPRSSDMVVIGLFCVIEAIVTHAPKLTESSDSLVHQIRTKMPLLRKRFQRPLRYSDFFEPCPETKIWGKLYEYRSRIIHGGTTEVDGDLRVLINEVSIINFLRETAKLTILAALKEPELVTDLKQC